MKVIFASLSAILLGSIPGVLSMEVSFSSCLYRDAFRGAACQFFVIVTYRPRMCSHSSLSRSVYLQPNLRGATLVTDFEDHATELINSMPSSVKKQLKKIEKDDDLTKKEIKSAQKKVIKKWERNTEKNCVEYLSAATCGAAKRCVWTKKGTCVSSRALDTDAEDYGYDFMANYPKKVEKELKNIKKDSDLTKKEIKSEQKSVIKSWEKRTEKYCAEYLSMTACDAVSKCEWNEDGCVSSKAFADAEDYDYYQVYDWEM